jgi:hypothetical protein
MMHCAQEAVQDAGERLKEGAEGVKERVTEGLEGARDAVKVGGSVLPLTCQLVHKLRS